MESHPQRYPTHKNQEKGQVFGGECNIPLCSNGSASWWNLRTYAFFCDSCADRVNYPKTEPRICIKVKEKPEVRDMEKLKKDNHQ